MRSFRAEKLWTPDGSRPHILIPVTPEVVELAEVYTTVIPAWSRERAQHLPPVRPQFLHITVTWLDTPTADVIPNWIEELETAVAAQLVDLVPFPMRLGPATPVTYGVELVVGPDEPAAELARRCQQAMRTVFGTDAPVASPAQYRPHCSLSYCQATLDEEGLGSTLLSAVPAGGQYRPAPVEMTVDSVIITDQDTFADGGLRWNQDTVRTVSFGAV
jgi:hypothetical protein